MYYSYKATSAPCPVFAALEDSQGAISRPHVSPPDCAQIGGMATVVRQYFVDGFYPTVVLSANASAPCAEFVHAHKSFLLLEFANSSARFNLKLAC
jgi:hypothetical protein